MNSHGRFCYSIDLFSYNKETNTFEGHAEDLWVDGYNYPFPNHRKQFVVVNLKTGGFRRFTMSKEERTEDGLFYLFVSEDLIKCRVKIKSKIFW